MLKISFSQEDIEVCKKFSEEVDTSLYAKRNQWDATKRRSDSNIGKLGEFAVYHLLQDKYPTITLPDCKIYTAKQKSWDYDLKTEDFSLHIKSQEILQSAKYSFSWLFENTDKHIFKNYQMNDHVAFVSVNFLQKTAEIKSIIKVSTLHEMQLFKKPVLAKLITKSAVYYEDLKDLPFSL